MPFKYKAEQFEDTKILRYQIPDFNKLTIKQKKLLYYLQEASLSGRDIYYDQNYKFNLIIRDILEAILTTYKESKKSKEYINFLNYTKKLWISNGIHDAYSTIKTKPKFTKTFLKNQLLKVPLSKLPIDTEKHRTKLINFMTPLIFDTKLDNKKVNLNSKDDLIKTSAVNFYENINQKEAENYYSKLSKKYKNLSHGLNSKLIKENGKIKELVYKVNGLYTEAIEKIVYNLEHAKRYSENKEQEKVLEKLIEYYQTGDLKKYDQYCELWLKNKNSRVDLITGFVEQYNDPLGIKGTYESIISIKDLKATKRVDIIAKNVQWFEDNSPTSKEFKKKKVQGIQGKAINVVTEAGAASPLTPIGVNLPNQRYLKEKYGSKSVTLSNIIYSYNQVSKKSGALEEFAYSEEDIKLSKKYGELAYDLLVDLHEIVGHGSGKTKKGVPDYTVTLKNYGSTIEEARADLFALYYLMDKKLINLKLMPSLDVGKTFYDGFIKGGLMLQLVRIKPGEDIEEAHMRNRQLIAKWCYEKGKKQNVIEKKVKNNKTYFIINDYLKLRELFGELLKEIQRIVSVGDYKAAKHLVETYAIKVDKKLHLETLKRWNKLKIASFSAFINPILYPIYNSNKQIKDIKVKYPDNFKDQMLYYSKNYSYLPLFN